jgi:siroheme synthase
VLARADIVFLRCAYGTDLLRATSAEKVAVEYVADGDLTAQRFINKRLIDAAAKFGTVVR